MHHHFASDNNAGICPEALAGLLEANAGPHASAYGDDAWTERARTAVRSLLEAPEAVVHFVFNGTAANALALAHLCRPYHAIIAHAASHAATDEAGAPGYFTGGSWLRTADSRDAKLTPADIDRLAAAGRGVHSTKPRVVSITQATERGTVYSAAELGRLSAAARRAGLAVHMDGARLANAVARLGCPPADITWRAGVDILSLGGVKNGLGVGEALVVFDPEAGREIEWRIKQSGHLNSKMRLVTAPWARLIETGAWLANARHANAMAQRLAGPAGANRRAPHRPSGRGERRVRRDAGGGAGGGAGERLALLHLRGRNDLPADVRLGYEPRDGRPLRRRHRSRRGRA